MESSSSAKENLQRRGPDSCQQVLIPSTSDRIQKISLHASVLKMRETLVRQPVELAVQSTSNHGGPFFLCWNGEVYDSVDHHEAGDFATSDTRLVASLMEKHGQDSTDKDSEDGSEVMMTRLAEILGNLYDAEYAFMVINSDQVLFGRDPWGRRSLLRWDCPASQCKSFQIMSTAENDNSTNNDAASTSTNEQESPWKEITPGVVHKIELTDTTVSSTLIPYLQPPETRDQLPDLLPATPDGVSEAMWRASFVLERLLSNAVVKRMDHSGCRPSAVLFSGGLDSAVVAALAAQHCKDTLHLYNVSFGDTYEKSADRKAALVTHEGLQGQHPGKAIVFRDIIVHWEDICRHEPHIRTLLQPKSTLMDVNIATALWFASRGQVCGEEENYTEDSSGSRVLLLGMGADEQLGGYGRHRKAFDRGGMEELAAELAMDQARFWERNLGRDDRIAADHGKEARFPFLDAHVTGFLKSLPLEHVVDFSLPPGHGDKRILRLVALRLGLGHASGLVKRAIQFGSRISHLSDAKRFGSRRKAKGDAKVKHTAK